MTFVLDGKPEFRFDKDVKRMLVNFYPAEHGMDEAAEQADLEQWAREFSIELSASHESDVFSSLVALANALGFQHVAFGMELPTSISKPLFSYWCNFPEDWISKFIERKVEHHGSQVAYHKRLSLPAPGSDEYNWSRCDFQREAEAYGIKFQWQQKATGRCSTVALIGLSGKDSLLSEFDKKRLTILFNTTVDAMATRLLDKHLPGHRVQITEDERKYLCWVLDGKTADEIIDILRVPKNRVDTMQRNLPLRFEKKGIFATAFMAYRFGMLDPDAECLDDPAPADPAAEPLPTDPPDVASSG